MPRLIHLESLPPRTTPPDPASLPPWTPAAADLVLLELLWRYSYLTRELAALAVAHQDGGVALNTNGEPLRTQDGEPRRRTGAHVPHRLTQLWRHRYVTRFYRPSPAGSSQYVYALTRRGARLVLPTDAFSSAADETPSPPERRLKNLNKRKSSYEHTLAGILFRLLWDLAELQFPHILATAASWTDKDGDGSGRQGAIRNRFPVHLAGERTHLHPDATFWIDWRHTGREHGLQPLFLEVDRSHRNVTRTASRFRAYHELLTDGHAGVVAVARRHLGHARPPERGLVLFVAANSSHRDRLLALASETVSGSARRRFLFASFTDLFEGPEEARIIPPPQLFTRPIFRTLEGRPWTVVPSLQLDLPYASSAVPSANALA